MQKHTKTKQKQPQYKPVAGLMSNNVSLVRNLLTLARMTIKWKKKNELSQQSTHFDNKSQ